MMVLLARATEGSISPAAALELDLYLAMVILDGARKLNERIRGQIQKSDGDAGPAIRNLSGGRQSVRVESMEQLGAFVKSRGGGV